MPGAALTGVWGTRFVVPHIFINMQQCYRLNKQGHVQISCRCLPSFQHVWLRRCADEEERAGNEAYNRKPGPQREYLCSTDPNS